LAQESDWDLVVAAKNGEDRAFEILVKRYKARILSLAFHITSNREDAQDVVQQTFQKAFVHLQKFQGKSTFSTWLNRIAINEALMCLRKKRVSRTVSIEEVNRERDSVRSKVWVPEILSR
jgi:RNA polymerase sigma-70 factor, ECF subfamily